MRNGTYGKQGKWETRQLGDKINGNQDIGNRTNEKQNSWERKQFGNKIISKRFRKS